jgi:hypothetical protein
MREPGTVEPGDYFVGVIVILGLTILLMCVLPLDGPPLYLPGYRRYAVGTRPLGG